MRKVFSVLLLAAFVSSSLFAGDSKKVIRSLAIVAGIATLEYAIASRSPAAPEEPVRAIDFACIRPAVTGNETTVAIRAVRGAQYYPVRDKLILVLQEAGYTVLEARRPSENRPYAPRNGVTLSEFIASAGIGTGQTYENEALPVADYYLEETTTWVSGEENFRSLGYGGGGWYGYGYGGNYSRGQTEGTLRVSIAMFDGEGRAVPGKVSEAVVSLVLQSSRRGVLVVYSFSGFKGSFRGLADPATEATVRIIPKMFASNSGAR